MTDPNLFSSWLRSESDNGFACGQADALNNKPQRVDMLYAMPNGIQDKFTVEQWQELAGKRLESYNFGYRSVTTFTMAMHSKRDAEECMRSLKANGHQPHGVTVSKGQYGKVFTVSAAIIKSVKQLPYGAKVTEYSRPVIRFQPSRKSTIIHSGAKHTCKPTSTEQTSIVRNAVKL